MNNIHKNELSFSNDDGSLLDEIEIKLNKAITGYSEANNSTAKINSDVIVLDIKKLAKTTNLCYLQKYFFPAVLNTTKLVSGLSDVQDKNFQKEIEDMGIDKERCLNLGKLLNVYILDYKLSQSTEDSFCIIILQKLINLGVVTLKGEGKPLTQPKFENFIDQIDSKDIYTIVGAVATNFFMS